MSTQTGVWIDGSHAVVIAFTDGKKNITEIKAEIENRVHHSGEGKKGSFAGSQHINHEKTFEERRAHQADDYLEKVIGQIGDKGELYVFGPGEYPWMLEKKIKSIKGLKVEMKQTETADKLTLNQMVAKTRNFFNL